MTTYQKSPCNIYSYHRSLSLFIVRLYVDSIEREFSLPSPGDHLGLREDSKRPEHIDE